MPPGRAEDGIRFVSTRGCPAAGSGKSVTPFSRMHCANSRAADCCSGSALALKPRWLQVLAGADGPLPRRGAHAPPRRSNSPDASGSGNSGTPFSRMHSANFTAFSCSVAGLFPQRCCVRCCWGGAIWRCRSWWRCRSRKVRPNHSPRWIRATTARAAAAERSSSRSLLHPWVVRRVGVHGGAAVIEAPRGAARSARARCRRSGTARTRRRARTATPRHRRARCRPRRPRRERTCRGWPPIAWPRLPSRTSRSPHGGAAPGMPGTPAAVDDELDPVVRGIGRGAAQGTEERRIEPGHPRDPLVEDRRAVGDGTVGLAERTTVPTDRRAAGDDTERFAQAHHGADRPARCRGPHRQPGQAHHGADRDGRGWAARLCR